MTSSPVKNRVRKDKTGKSYEVKKQIILSGLIKGNSVTINDHEEMEIVHNFNDIMICEKFGRTLEYVRSMNQVDYEEVKLILQKRSAIQHAENERQKKRKK